MLFQLWAIGGGGVSPLQNGPVTIVRKFKQKISNGSSQILRKAQNT